MNFPEPGRTLQQAPKNEAPARGTRKSVPIQKELPNLDFPFGNTDLRYQMREQNQTINSSLPSPPVKERTRVYGLTREISSRADFPFFFFFLFFFFKKKNVESVWDNETQSAQAFQVY
jgi:hypothetical protein